MPVLFIFSCKQSSTKDQILINQIVQSDSTKTIVDDKIPALTPGEFSYAEEDFGELIELQGTSHPVNEIFQVKETEMIVKDSIIIIKNLNDQNLFMSYTLPDFKHIKTFGKRGKGPGEFQYPRLVKVQDEHILCYIYEQTRDKLFALNNQLEITGPPISLPQSTSVKTIGDKQIHSFSKDQFFYTESIPKGKAFIEWIVNGDTAFHHQLLKLSFSEDHKNWAAYIGDFGANSKHKRLVYAYKYFKRLLFYDIENQTTRVISFEQKETKEGNAASMLDASNVTHYWGMSAEPNYLYVLYSGRTPIQVTKEMKESNGYIFVEQYDWNGNPIRKFKLDHWGYFCVDENQNKIYLASITEEHPFVSYKISD